MTRPTGLYLVFLAGVVGGGLNGCDKSGKKPAAAPQALPPQGLAFRDVTTASGLDFVHRSGAGGQFRLPEIMAGGGGFLDIDGDGWLDIYLVQSADSEINRLYHNRGNGTFTDVTERSGTGDRGYGMGCAAGDIDNDGDVDLYVTNFGPNVLYMNNGQGVFHDSTSAAGVAAAAWSSSATFLDYDRDGWLDLFVANYVDWRNTPTFLARPCYGKNGARDYCSPQAYDAPAADHLFRNKGDGTFEDVSLASGIASKPGTGLGVVRADLDDDGWPDIYVSNDQMASFAWINQRNGTFVDSAVTLGCAVDDMGRPQAGMGVHCADIDADGDTDLWKVHLQRESHILYINRGSYFDDRTSAWGLAAPTMPFTGFGTALVDLDLDGLLDIFVANGRVQYQTAAFVSADIYAEPNQILRQHPAGRFSDASAALSAHNKPTSSRAAAFGDYDNDGDIDILVVHRDNAAQLLRNDSKRLGGFLSVRLIETSGRDAYGARLMGTLDGLPSVREVRAGYSYCATNDPRIHVGTGRARTLENVSVRWADGAIEHFDPLPADRPARLQRGRGHSPAAP